MPWTKEDRSFKTLINKLVTNNSKAYYEEFGADTLDLHVTELKIDNIYISDVSTGAAERAQLVSDGVLEYFTLFPLTLDNSVPSNRSFIARDGLGNRLTDWVGPKYNAPNEAAVAGYQILLYDNNNTQIFPTNAIDWFFDYQTGVLTLNGNAPSNLPFKISGWRYIGRKSINAVVDISSGTAGTVITYLDGTTENVPIFSGGIDLLEAGTNFDVDGYIATRSDLSTFFAPLPKVVRTIDSVNSLIIYSDNTTGPISLSGGNAIINIENNTLGNGQILTYGDLSTQNVVIESWDDVPFATYKASPSGYKSYDIDHFYLATDDNLWKRIKLEEFLAGDDYLPTPPENTASNGVMGQISFDNDFLYICYAPNRWKRTNLDLFNDLSPITEPLYSDGEAWVTRPNIFNASGIRGQRAFDDDYLYVCVQNNLWKRTNLDLFLNADVDSSIGVVNSFWVDKPSESFDASGSRGDKAFDENFFYLKVTSTLWKRFNFDLFGSVFGGAGIIVETFTSNGTDTEFQVLNNLQMINYVTINGVMQSPLNYTSSINSVIFNTAPLNGYIILVSYFTEVVDVVQLNIPSVPVVTGTPDSIAKFSSTGQGVESSNISDDGSEIIINSGVGGVSLRHNDSLKLNTLTDGVLVTGILYATDDLTVTSDIKIKENILTLENSLEKVKQLRGVSYNRKDKNDGKTHIGFIAQEVQEVVPELVHYSKDMDLNTVDYQKMVPILLEAIKELSKQVDELKNKLNNK
jgi:hypothetical protein